MNMLAPQIPGCRWLDLCCGSGVMACEAMRRGAREVVAVERDRRVAAVARANLELIQASLVPRESQDGEPVAVTKVTLVSDEVVRWLERAGTDGSQAQAPEAGRAIERGFDLIYVDPPYRGDLYERIAQRVTRGGWLAPTGTMVWECATDQLPHVPQGWRAFDGRRYGGTSLILLEANPELQR